MVDNIYHAASYKGNRYFNKNTIGAITCALSGIRNCCSQNDFVSFQNLVHCGSYQFFMGNGKVADLFCYWPAVISTFKSQYIVVVYPLDKGGGGEGARWM